MENMDFKVGFIIIFEGGVFGIMVFVFMFYDGFEKFFIFDFFDGIFFLVSGMFFNCKWINFIVSFFVELKLNFWGIFVSVLILILIMRFLDVIKNEMDLIGLIKGLKIGMIVLYDIEFFIQYGVYVIDSVFFYVDFFLFVSYSINFLLLIVILILIGYQLNFYFFWVSVVYDEYWYNWMKQLIVMFKQVVIEEGIYLEFFILYLNYVILGIMVEEFYGEVNVERLREIRDIYDFEKVMDFVGGFEI